MRWLKLIPLFLLIFLVGCASQINSGYITQKHWSPSYTYFTQQCVAYNQDMACISWIQIPHTMPESYKFDIKSGEKTGWVYVDPVTYGQYEVGDHYG